MAAAIALVTAAGCGAGDEPEAPGTQAKAAGPSPVLGTYTQVLRLRDLPGEADRASAGRYQLLLKPASFESFTPKGPGFAGEGRPTGRDRYEFGKGYRQECEAPATYVVRTEGRRLALEAVGSDPCPLRREVLTTATWKRAKMP